ncbi:hypothetical protein DFQ27_002838 [Actinomortierella ambigua]|uniref:Uncharacterized protein n=1 Tax=Actinomortierella ambigua TaxID=1343610 RepID=A0A9P6QJL0_9FUNG|nr:hypothetical protein DFQ27_002838 [Actinomortierella ambigua]
MPSPWQMESLMNDQSTHENSGSTSLSTKVSPTPYRALEIPELLNHILGYALSLAFTCITDAIDHDLDPRCSRRAVRMMRRRRLWILMLERENCADELVVSLAEHLDLDRPASTMMEAPASVEGVETRAPSHKNKRLLSQSKPSLTELCMTGFFDIHTHLPQILSIPTLHQNLTLVSLHFTNFTEFDVTQFFESDVGEDPPSNAIDPTQGIEEGPDWQPSSHSHARPRQFPPLPNLQHLLLFDVTMPAIPPTWRLKGPPQLRSLCLERARGQRGRLETFLRPVCGPKMEHLRISGPLVGTQLARRTTISRLNGIIPVPVDIFEDIVMKQCRRLQSIEVFDSEPFDTMARLRGLFSHIETIRVNDWVFIFLPASPIRLIRSTAMALGRTNTPTTTTTTTAIAAAAADSHASSLSWPVVDGNPSILMQPTERFLTRLEIDKHYCDGNAPMDTFHRFMCSPEARHLIEVHAWHVLCRVNNLTQEQGRWTCQNLQVLVLGFYRESNTGATAADAIARHVLRKGDSRPMSHGTESELVWSRLTFGYLTSVLPMVRHVRLNASFLNLTKGAGGFCFTSRWRHLETLYMLAYDVYSLSGGSGGGGGGAGAGMGGTFGSLYTVEEPRWMLREPTQDDRFRGRDSLQYCRKVVKMSHMHSHWGGGDATDDADHDKASPFLMIRDSRQFPPHPSFSNQNPLHVLTEPHHPPGPKMSLVYPSEIDLLDSIEASGSMSPLDWSAVRAGCCWSQLGSIHIDTLSPFEVTQSELKATLGVWQRLRPDIKFVANQI